MEYNVFRDYCKAENSEDEDVNHDLQSRLYAEIYYASNDIDNVDTKSDIKLETVNTDDDILHIDANDSKICYTSLKNNNEDCKILDNSVNKLEDNKPDITSVSVTSTSETLCKDKSENDISAVTVKEEEEGKEIELSTNKKQLTSNSVEYVTSRLNCNDIRDIENDIKPKIEDENKEELKLLQCSNNKATTNQCVSPNPTKHDSDNNKYQETMSNEKDINNILRKYEFSKSFINKLYLEKYENLEKKLQEVEEEERLQEKQEKMSVKKSVNDKKMDTKYEFFNTTEKLQKATNYSQEIVLSSETESDSDESILEVPIPPKPQPPIINLKDSDEESEISSNDSDIGDELSFVKRKKKNSVKDFEKETFIIDRYLESYVLNTDSIDDTTGREDIILNCTEIQKGASSIKEIMEMSKNIQPERHVDKDSTPDVQSPSKIVHANAIYERDKNESINFAEDVTVTNFLNSHESTPNRKRYYDPCEPCTSDSEPCTSVKQRKNIESEDDHLKENTEHDSNAKINQDWEEYFFRPMSEKLKAFYEFQGQQDFDIKKIQSDPRLWTILDEDLMPDLFRHQRYWHMKCTKCRQQGHQRHNCPEPYKPLRCHMCGTQGHTETRCPQKMCLTCGKKQGTFRKTCEACRILHCNMCNAVGHKSTECPDLWRRFHQTTRTCEINIPENLSEVMKPADLLYCCNCTKRGHDSSTCNEYRWSQHFPTPAFVSNYTGELQNEVPTCENITEDVIPLIKPTKAKHRTFLPDKNDLEGLCVIYSYGTFYTKKLHGEQNVRKLFTLDIHPSHLTSLLKGRVAPTFLDELSKVVKFEIKMYYDVSNELMIRVRSIKHLPQHILELFLYWLKLDDEDKHLEITINLPRGNKKLSRYLTSKIEELHKNLGDPNHICAEIEQLEISLNATQNPETSVSILQKLMDYRGNLRKIYLTKPKNKDLILQLRKCIKHLRKCSVDEVYLEKYLKIIVIYNKIFLPRKLTDTELKRFLAKYYKKQGNNNKTEKNNEIKKAKKGKLSTYLAFIESLKSTNSNTDGCSSKNIKAQGKQKPTVVSIENISVNNNVQGITHVENILNETCTSEKHVNEHVNIDSIVSTQSACNVSNSNEVIMTKPIRKVNLNTVSSNLITIPLQKSTHNVSLRSPKSVPCAKIKPSENNTEKDLELINSNNEEAKINKVQEKQDNIIDSETSVTKKKKSKKAKKTKLDVENKLEVTENKKTDIDTSLENKANDIINEALEFNLPYMNKAVEEVRKKINDKSLKQEHIDTLLRLINLEKDHRKYVSSFYNYLQ
ncbi:hypothetical protein QLX08_001397 [Tetragonisca angustula]|uniref:Zinc finger CCHC domain-containing protein 7 n=1 Tax=Tetragonisca angustula TaxID=166442 RepID=A0AAW1AHR2_9HYME